MNGLTISEVARRAGLRPSAIRYYEQMGILPAAGRTGGQRRYGAAALYRLAVVQRARQAGFSLEEIRVLFFGFGEGTRAEARWRKLAERKLAELDAMAEGIKGMKDVLNRMSAKCQCATLEACGKAIFERSGIATVEQPRWKLASHRRQ